MEDSVHLIFHVSSLIAASDHLAIFQHQDDGENDWAFVGVYFFDTAQDPVSLYDTI